MSKRAFTSFLLWLALNVSPALADKRADAYYEQAIRQHGSAPIEEVFSLYARAAEAGNAAAQYNVAMMYANGEAVNVDYQQAVYWFRKSSAQNFAPAKHRLGELYLFGMGGLKRDRAMATGLFRHGAELGDTDAQMNYAMILAGAEGGALTRQEALTWMEKAQQGGHEAATHYSELLRAAGDQGLTPQQQQAYWDRQKYYWIEMAAAYGVREAEEAVGATAGPEKP
jgi:TPR repeat protein